MKINGEQIDINISSVSSPAEIENERVNQLTVSATKRRKFPKRSKSFSGSKMWDSWSDCVDHLSDRHHEYLIINFSTDYLKEIPGNKLVKLIRESYPEYLDENKKLTIDGLINIIKLGAKLNHCDCISDEMISELAHILDLPFELTDDYINNISNIMNTLSSGHRTRNVRSVDRYRGRRQGLVINPDARIVHYNTQKAPKIMDQSSRIEPENKKQKNFVAKKYKWAFWLNTKVRYTCVNLVLLLISFVLFLIFATVTYFSKAYELFGPGLLFSRGAALAILIFTMLAMFFVSYDVTSWVRKKLKGRCSTVFDFQILFHRFCGYTILVYSVIHTIGHLTGSFRGLHIEKDLNKINEALTHHEMKEHLPYHRLLFTTLPGVTGLILLAIISLMGVTALQCVRTKFFQLFSLVHVIGFPLFILLIIAHGSQSWLNYGFPLGSITVSFSLIIYLIYVIRRTILQWRGRFSVLKSHVSDDKQFLQLTLDKPKNYKYSLGQYSFINIPAISWWEWHPFSIASCSRSDKIKFIIKNSGDWTGKVLELFSEYNQNPLALVNNFMETGQERDPEALYDFEDRPYPKVNLSYPISSPVQQSAYNYNVVYVAAGVGVTTFLSFMELQLLKARNSADKGDTNICKLDNKEVIDFIFISRETENIRWIAKYINAALTLPQMTQKIKFHIYITLKDESNNLASFLFWRSLAFYNKKLCKNNKMYSKINITLGRPDFDKLLDKILHKNHFPDHYVYACGGKPLTAALEKICVTKAKEEKMKIRFNYEIFS